ncbi:hypothetical protein POM88_028901 [Heracleum sosnowskyi]|uniref:Uncharacterized protein n=1 Tax=Heracleum sosnowskyi TaxID=360622 RepID=A0AAD8MI07_9APIA|nr:hypothetical protein POM88_028901 [Heracleum sosnowskyi]
MRIAERYAAILDHILQKTEARVQEAERLALEEEKDYTDIDECCVVSTCLKELVLTDCVNVHLMNWTLPSLTSLYLKNVKFGNQISGFDKLETLTVAGFIHKTFTINCGNLKFLNLGPDFSSCTLVVSTPNLSIFKLCSADHVPSFSSGVVFPFIMEAHFDIKIKDPDWASYDSDMIDLTMQNFTALINAVSGNQWLWLSRQTIQASTFFCYSVIRFCKYSCEYFVKMTESGLTFMSHVCLHEKQTYQHISFLHFVTYLLGIHEKPTRSTDHVIDYLVLHLRQRSCMSSPNSMAIKGFPLVLPCTHSHVA